VAAKLLEPIVIDAQQLVTGFLVVELRGGAEHTEDDLGVDPIHLHVLEPEMRVTGAVSALLGVVVKADLIHLVDPMVLAGDVFRAARADAIHQTEIRAVAGDPMRPVRSIDDMRHLISQGARGVLHEQLRRHARHVEVAIGGDALVLHGRSLRGHAWARLGRTVTPPGEICLCCNCSPPCHC